MEEEPRRASFNMAIATLGRLDNILTRMERVSEMTNGLNEQRLHIKLLRHFMMNASPLMIQIMKPEELKKYREEVFGIKIRTRIKKGRAVEHYSEELSNKIMGIAMDIQNELREHFMPRGDDDDNEL